MLTVETLKSSRNPMCQLCFFQRAECQKECAFAGREPNIAEEKATLFYEGDDFRGLFEIKAGVVKITKYLADGRRFIIGFFYPGDLIGLAHDDRYTYTAEAVTEVAYTIVRLDHLEEEIRRNAKLTSRFVAMMGREIEAVQEHMLLLARKTPIEKMASFLLNQAKRMGTEESSTVELQMCRSDIADHLGLTIETVCRVLTKMKNMKVIEINHVKNVQFCNYDALIDFAEGDEDAVLAA